MRYEGGNARVVFPVDHYDAVPVPHDGTGEGEFMMVTVIRVLTSHTGQACLPLGPHFPNTRPHNLPFRIIKGGNVPQFQFNEDSVWHDFAPRGYLSVTPKVLHVHVALLLYTLRLDQAGGAAWTVPSI